jgi:type IV pilus assembly protein PilA
MKPHRKPQAAVTRRLGHVAGFTLIELMIVVSIVGVILTLALPVYSNYSIRARVGEGLAVAAAAKTAAAATCIENPTIAVLTPGDAGYSFQPSPYVTSIDISGPCSAPVITVTTRNTGTLPDIVLALTGSFAPGDSRMTWSCTSNASKIYLPRTCRS